MLRSVLLFLLLFIFSVMSSASGALSYGQLARMRSKSAWVELEKALGAISENSLPHETKNLRKLIVAVREQLDLFVFAYPIQDAKVDLFEIIRNDLDRGYELVGEFKDIFDAQGISDPTMVRYNKFEVAKQLRPVLAWKHQWDENKLYYKRFVLSPSKNEIFLRKKKFLSRFYWGATDRLPDLEITGEANLSLLCGDLLEQAGNDWKRVNDIKNPSVHHRDEELFHDFRKRLRSVSRIIRSMDADTLAFESDLEQLEKVVEEYGRINDMIVRLHQLTKKGETKKAKSLSDDVEKAWTELLYFQQEIGIDQVMKSIRKSLKYNF